MKRIKEKSTKGIFANIDHGDANVSLVLVLVSCLFLALAGVSIVSSIETNFIKKNGDMYTINAEYTRSYVDGKLRSYDIYKTEENDTEIQYIMVFADSENAEPVFGENTVFTVYKYGSETLCYVGGKRIRCDFLSDNMFLLLTEGKRVKTE